MSISAWLRKATTELYPLVGHLNLTTHRPLAYPNAMLRVHSTTYMKELSPRIHPPQRSSGKLDRKRNRDEKSEDDVDDFPEDACNPEVHNNELKQKGIKAGWDSLKVVLRKQRDRREPQRRVWFTFVGSEPTAQETR